MLIIQNSSCRLLLGIIDDILDLSRFELKTFQLDKSWFRFNSIIEDVREVIEPMIKMKNLQLVVDMQQEC